ncbi:uncharacterized protein [Musca autumnalis]|uniref:uncharacterized protein n=1 Tax=Musca autumnalis TaxID=221902 RepID=UPI003CED5409
MTSIVWANYKNLQIRDVHEKQRPQIKEYILKNVLNNAVYQVLKYHENPTFKEDLSRIIQHILENDSSILVMDMENNEIQGIALMKCMSEEWRSWTALKVLISNQNLEELIDLTKISITNASEEIPEPWDSLHLFYYHIDPIWSEDLCLISKFFLAISMVGQNMRMPRVTYMALCREEGLMFEEQGFKELWRILYSMYVYRDRRPFDHLRDLNEMYGCLYEKKLEALRPFQELTIRHDGGNEKETSEKKAIK